MAFNRCVTEFTATCCHLANISASQLPDIVDKTYLLQKLRTMGNVGLWTFCNDPLFMQYVCKQETRMPSQALNRAMPRSRNHKELIKRR